MVPTYLTLPHKCELQLKWTSAIKDLFTVAFSSVFVCLLTR